MENAERVKTWNVAEAIVAQRKLQKEKEYPDFAPNDGRCYDCKQQIYSEIDHGSFKTGIWVDKAATSLITGCPHCHRSYCD